jgi:hypothetical protein
MRRKRFALNNVLGYDIAIAAKGMLSRLACWSVWDFVGTR